MQSYNAILPTNNVIFTLLGEQKERHIAGAVTLTSDACARYVPR